MIGKGNDLRVNRQLKEGAPQVGGGQSRSAHQWQSGVIRWRRATQSGIMRQQGRLPCRSECCARCTLIAFYLIPHTDI